MVVRSWKWGQPQVATLAFLFWLTILGQLPAHDASNSSATAGTVLTICEAKQSPVEGDAAGVHSRCGHMAKPGLACALCRSG